MPLRRAPQARWRAAVCLHKCGIEATDAAEPGGEGDLGKRQIALVDQTLRRLTPMGRGDGAWPGTDMADEEPAKVAGADAEPVRQLRHRAAVEETLIDQPHAAYHRRLSPEPGRAARRRLGPAAQARSETGLLGLRRGAKEDDVLRPRRVHGTDRAAIDPGSANGGEENPVIAAIAGDPRMLADIPVKAGTVIV